MEDLIIQPEDKKASFNIAVSVFVQLLFILIIYFISIALSFGLWMFGGIFIIPFLILSIPFALYFFPRFFYISKIKNLAKKQIIYNPQAVIKKSSQIFSKFLLYSTILWSIFIGLQLFISFVLSDIRDNLFIILTVESAIIVVPLFLAIGIAVYFHFLGKKFAYDILVNKAVSNEQNAPAISKSENIFIYIFFGLLFLLSILLALFYLYLIFNADFSA